jgi:hypothetical protein
MNCYLITAPGEIIEANELMARKDYGYNIIKFDSTQTDEELCDTSESILEANKFLAPVMHSIKADKPYVRALRNSWVRMLRENIDAPLYTIFGESDAVPVIKADQLEAILTSAFIKFPDAEVVRLFIDHTDTPYLPGEAVVFSKWEQTNTGKSSYTKEKFGTHALIIHPKSRQKLIAAIKTTTLPVDTLLDYLSDKGELNVVSADKNLFYQKSRTYKADASTLYSNKEHKFALMMMSYKRPSELLRQIYAMMDQAYPKERYHFYVAVKGMDPKTYNLFYSLIKHFVQEDRLSIKLCANSDQLTNFIDTIRSVPESVLKTYDKFVKIDDDDFYRRDYLFKLNEFLKEHSPNVSTCARQMYSYLLMTGQKSVPYTQPVFNSFYGNTLVFPYMILKLAQSAEVSRAERLKWEEKIPKNNKIGNTEDALIDTIMLQHGCIFLSDYFGKSEWFTITTVNNPSIQRGGLLPEELRMDVLHYHPEKYKKERVVEIQHASGVVNKIHIYGEVGTIVDEAPIRECKVISYETKALSLEWFNETPGKVDNYTRTSTFLPFIYENTVDKL